MHINQCVIISKINDRDMWMRVLVFAIRMNRVFPTSIFFSVKSKIDYISEACANPFPFWHTHLMNSKHICFFPLNWYVLFVLFHGKYHHCLWYKQNLQIKVMLIRLRGYFRCVSNHIDFTPRKLSLLFWFVFPCRYELQLCVYRVSQTNHKRIIWVSIDNGFGVYRHWLQAIDHWRFMTCLNLRNTFRIAVAKNSVKIIWCNSYWTVWRALIFDSKFKMVCLPH